MQGTDYKKFFEDKRITLMGLGLLGRGVGDAEFLAKCGARLTVTDLKPERELRRSLAKLKKYKSIRFVLGQHRVEDFRDTDMVIKSAGVPLNSPFIAEARKHGVAVEMSTALFARFETGKIVGVTGTRGKSTITHLIHEILKLSGGKVHLGGNVRGVSTLALLPRVKEGDISVLELDSWQLQGFGRAKISPHIAVFSNFLSDHLNYYQGDMRQYFADKAQIFLHQKKGDHLVAGREVASEIRKYLSRRVYEGKMCVPAYLPRSYKISLPGEHNRQNIGLALEVARILGVSDNIIRKVFKNFREVPGRLEFVRELRGVRVYNDTTATTPDATLAALKTLAGKKKLVLIMGGADKQLPMEKLLKVLSQYCKKVVLLPGSGTDKLKLSASTEKMVVRANNLPGAVREGLEGARRGDILLFSPAFASFGLFKNEFDRGEKFLKIVQKLT